MRSELFRIPIEVGGVPIFGVGVLLAVWLVVAAVVGWRMRRTPEGRAELPGLLPMFAVVSAALIGLPYVMPGGLPIRGYGVMLVLAASSGLAMAIHRGRQHGLDADAILSMAFAMFVLGIAGARLFFVIEYWDVAFASEEGFFAGLKKAVMFTEGGLVVYGSLIGGAIAFAWFCRARKLPMLAMADLIAPSLAVGLAIGRIGCLLNGCCYGGVCDRPWAVTFPSTSPPYADQVSSGDFYGFHWEADPADKRPIITSVSSEAATAGLAVGEEITSAAGNAIQSPEQLAALIELVYAKQTPLVVGLASGDGATLPAAPTRARSLPVHPTQIYSAVNAGLLGWFLWLYYPRRRRDGEVAALLLTIYPVGRFLLEIIRTDESSFFGTGLSISQNVSLALLAAMVVAWALLLTRPPARTQQLATP